MEQREKDNIVPIWRKYALTVHEASLYYNIGEKTLRILIEQYSYYNFSFKIGKKILIKRELFEKFLNSAGDIL